MRDRFHRADRGVSITVTHALTIAITTVLITMLLMAGGTLLENQKENSARLSLETVGERLSDELSNVDRAAIGTNDEVTATADHPRTVAGSSYTVELLPASECGDGRFLDGSTECLKLTATDADTVVYVPVKIDAEIDDDSKTVPGGTIEIRHRSDTGDPTTSEISIHGGTR
ncbi:DUF7266 family protein [Natrinema altunense]|uniref:Uncharacterized protein n=1 Tax=Natrinema altunense TaxID=222984 RepID=A0A482Y087_9EURY|nr:hypothetical protein [Natrinema altunense]RZH67575.1 hypothetical protein ELS17_12005 [Natrinema altunense]